MGGTLRDLDLYGRFGIWRLNGRQHTSWNCSVIMSEAIISERRLQTIKEGMLTHLWDEETGRFARGLIQKDNRWVKDMTLESSMFGIWEFGVLPVDDSRLFGR